MASDAPDAGNERADSGAHVGASHAVDAQEEAGSLTLVGETVQSARSDVLSRYGLVIVESSGLEHMLLSLTKSLLAAESTKSKIAALMMSGRTLICARSMASTKGLAAAEVAFFVVARSAGSVALTIRPTTKMDPAVRDAEKDISTGAASRAMETNPYRRRK